MPWPHGGTQVWPPQKLNVHFHPAGHCAGPPGHGGDCEQNSFPAQAQQPELLATPFFCALAPG
ncbi:MAG: hypothetical protein E6G67_10155 [Actinobacteria bacterium]|nr:MAG: hypothetical protein E6G67_10155 [Actinomycetota bacterium]